MTLMKPATLKLLLLSCCVLIAIALFTRQEIITHHGIITYGGTDLRVRIVRSRLMAANLNP